MTDVKQIKCARCQCGLKGPADPQPHDRIACPECGEGDTVERVMAEVGEYVQEQVAQSIHQSLTEGIGSSPNLKVTTDFRPKGGHRFIVDLDLHQMPSS
jgi:hypothetical protein